MQLKNVFSVLNYERLKNPVLLGSTVFGKDDIYKMWKKFVSKVLESYAEMPKFYFVKVYSKNSCHSLCEWASFLIKFSIFLLLRMQSCFLEA